MTARHIILGVASLAVLGMALYLWHEVGTTTADSAVPQRTVPARTAASSGDAETAPPEAETKTASRSATAARAAPPSASAATWTSSGVARPQCPQTLGLSAVLLFAQGFPQPAVWSRACSASLVQIPLFSFAATCGSFSGMSTRRVSGRSCSLG